MEDLKYEIEIQGKKLIIQELSVDVGIDFTQFIVDGFFNIDFAKFDDPKKLYSEVLKLCKKEYTRFCEIIFQGQKTDGINWKKIGFLNLLIIINFFFKCNKGSVDELLKLWQSSASKEMAAEVEELVKDTTQK